MKKIYFFKTLLMAAALMMGSGSAWAADSYTWTFQNNTSTWTTAMISTGSAVTYDQNGIAEGNDGYSGYGVTFLFDNSTAGSEGGKVQWYYNSSSSGYTTLWWENSGSATTNNVSISVPAGFKVIFNMVCTSSRPMGYQIGSNASTTTSNSTLEYMNETGSPVTITLWGTNSASGNRRMNGLLSIVLEDYTSASTYSWSAKAVIKGSSTEIDKWDGDAYFEGESYNVWAKKVITYNGDYYELDDDNFATNEVYFSTTMGDADIEHEISYTLNNDIAYYIEGEDVKSTQHTSSVIASGGEYINYYNGTTNISLTNAGVYRMETNVLSRGTDSGLRVYDSSDNVIDGFYREGTGYKKTGNFLLSANSTIKVGMSGANTAGIDYILIRKMYSVTDASNIVGAIDFSTGANAATSEDYTLKPGETKVFTFQNHGQDFGKNWRILVKEGEEWKSTTCADSWDYTKGAATKVSYQVSKDGGSTKVNLDWDEYKADMNDARVVATLAYSTDGTLAITTTSTGTANGYIYYVDQDITGLTNDLTVNLSVNESWLEVLSVEQTSVAATVTSAGFATLYTDKALDFSGTGLTAYIASVDGNTVTLKAVDDVPANTGVVLKGEAKTYSIPVVASAANTEQGDLQGSATEATAHDAIDGKTLYILTIGEDEDAQFNPMTSGELAAGKAYLPVTTGAGTKLRVVFADGASAIKSIAADAAENAVIYNVAGQRVNAAYKGIVIKNSKKYLNK